MIISASRRTDIPAFYSAWLMNRLRAGYCLVRNPYNPNQVSRVSLAPEDVEVLVFTTRNPRPLLTHLDELDARGYRYLFSWTLTGYPRVLEPGLPDRATLLKAWEELAARIGPARIMWRYDPILLSNITDIAFHERNFRELAEALSGKTERVIISLLDAYGKNKPRLKRLAAEGIAVEEITEVNERIGGLLRNLSATARAHGLDIRSCADPWDLSDYGIPPGKCMDDEYIERVLGIEVTHAKDKSQRAACGCVQSKDIGAYDTCLHGCVYCYATRSHVDVAARYARHDPEAEGL